MLLETKGWSAWHDSRPLEQWVAQDIKLLLATDAVTERDDGADDDFSLTINGMKYEDSAPT